jgi:hypothetical protein
VDLFITLKDLAIFFPNYEESDVVVKLRDWICPESEQFSEEISYYYIGEFLNERLEMNLNVNIYILIFSLIRAFKAIYGELKSTQTIHKSRN